MKRLVYIITVLMAFWQALPALAVTDKEMEQARVIATQTYLRYANDGSGYLDALHPTTMAQLEKSLKAKEKENIKAFKAVPVPSDYASWDKQKLVDYWSNTAFSQAGLLPNGKVGKNPDGKKLSAMTIAAPATAAQAATASKPAEQKPAATPAATPAAETKPTATTAKPAETKPAESPIAEASLDSAQAEIDEARVLAEAALAAEDDGVIKKESTNTWIYVVVLCILVAVVVALVVFASNVMKKSAPALATQWNNGANSDEAKALARKLQESNRRLEEAERQNVQLRKKVDALTAEIAKLRTRPAPSQQPPIQGIPYPKQNTNPSPAPTTVQHAQASQQAPTQPTRPAQAPVAPTAAAAQATQPSLRTIYLGRANAKGIFVRADRTLNPGNSIFRLDTSDGLAGTFKVVSDPSVIEKVTEHPAEMLGMACVGPELANTSGLQAIVTDSAGTAIFEGGCWKVMRKAKIHYE